MGTLSDILKEAGYQQDGDGCNPPEFVSLNSMAVGIGLPQIGPVPYQTPCEFLRATGLRSFGSAAFI